MAGGAHTLITNNVIGDNSIRAPGLTSGVVVRAGVSDWIVQGNHVGGVFKGQSTSATKYGVEVEAGVSDRYVISANTLVGNLDGGLSDGGTGTHKALSANVMP